MHQTVRTQTAARKEQLLIPYVEAPETVTQPFVALLALELSRRVTKLLALVALVTH